MKPIWIELVNTGVANRFEFKDEEIIEMNWRLTKYPELYSSVIKHEMQHKDGNYSFHDFLHDMKSRTPGLFKFMGNHITAWVQILPFYWDSKKKNIVYDISSIISWVMMIGMVTIAYLGLRWLL